MSHADHHPLNAISVCSGIGGLDLAVERVLGARVVAYCEREAYAQAVLLERMEEEALVPAPIHFDLRELDGTRYRGLVDLVFGGIPCQPHSSAGKQRRGDDDRDLIDEFLRLVREVEPSFVVVENVRGFVSPGGLGRLLGPLAGFGFDAEWLCVKASDVGAPHRRERVFVLAYREHSRRCLGSPPYDDDRGDARRLDADGCDPAMADSSDDHGGRGERRSEERTGSDRERWRGSSGCGEDLADAECGGHDRRTDVEKRQQERRATPQGTGECLGNAERPRQEERGRDTLTRAFSAPWPPSPSGDWAAEPWWRYPALGTPPKLNPIFVESLMGLQVGWSYAYAEKARSPEALPAVRKEDEQEDDQRARRGYDGLPPQEVLQPPLYGAGLHQDRPDALCAAEEGGRVQERDVRGLRCDPGSERPPHGREPGEQPPIQPADLVQFLPPDLALAFRKDPTEEAVELAMRYRVDRLRCLGNAVVPAQAEAALRMLLERIG